MKFLLIINNDIDGVGQPAINLCSNLNKKGHKSKVISLHNFTKNKNIIKAKRSILLRLFLYVLNFLKKDFSDLFEFGYSATKYSSIKKYIDEADVIIIYTFYKIISNKILHKILDTKKLVYLRPLDIEMASGGCHLNQECKKYKSNCKSCPKLNALNLFDMSHINLIKKKKMFEQFKPKVFVQNNYVKNYFKSSSVFKNINTKVLFLGANNNRTKFYSKRDARKVLGFKTDEKIILFGTFNLASYVKGGHLLKESLKIIESKFMKEKFYNNSLKKVNLVTIGNTNGFSADTSKIKWTHLGMVSSDKKLNLLYRSADVLVCPSLYCFGPHIVTEALINDLPIVAFDLGVAQDSVINGINGYLVPSFNKLLFAKAICKVLLSKKKPRSVAVNRLKSVCTTEYETNSVIKDATRNLNRIKKYKNLSTLR